MEPVEMEDNREWQLAEMQKDYICQAASNIDDYFSELSADDILDLVSDKTYEAIRDAILDREVLDEDEGHLGCYSYPNCDVNPSGCLVKTNNPEQYGHKG
jgi:hypothetical protein